MVIAVVRPVKIKFKCCLFSKYFFYFQFEVKIRFCGNINSSITGNINCAKLFHTQCCNKTYNVICSIDGKINIEALLKIPICECKQYQSFIFSLECLKSS